MTVSHGYKELGIGKLIGAPVAGTMTAVWWETLMDRSLVFGIPQVGCREITYFSAILPSIGNIEVYNSPEDYITGHHTAYQSRRGNDEEVRKRNY